MTCSLETILRLSHILVFIGAFILAYGLYRVHCYRKQGPPAPLWVYFLITLIVVFIVGVIAHLIFRIKTKALYYLGLSDYPKYTIY